MQQHKHYHEFLWKKIIKVTFVLHFYSSCACMFRETLLQYPTPCDVEIFNLNYLSKAGGFSVKCDSSQSSFTEKKSFINKWILIKFKILWRKKLFSIWISCSDTRQRPWRISYYCAKYANTEVKYFHLVFFQKQVLIQTNFSHLIKATFRMYKMHLPKIYQDRDVGLWCICYSLNIHFLLFTKDTI